MQNAIGFGEPVNNWNPPPRPPRAPMEGMYVRLEPLDPDRHAADLFAANQLDDTIWNFMPYGPFETLGDYQTWLKADCLGDDPLFHAVIPKSTGKAVGIASYLRIAPEAGSIEVGHINFAKPLQRTREGTEAMYMMMRRAFELGYRRYEWKCNALNMGSRSLAQRLGMSYEGIFRQATIVKGRNRDTAWYAAIDKEWPELSEAFDTWLSPDNFGEDGRQIARLSDLTQSILVAIG